MLAKRWTTNSAPKLVFEKSGQWQWWLNTCLSIVIELSSAISKLFQLCIYYITFFWKRILPFHPTAQPLSHWPVTWIHTVLSLHSPEHCCLQSRPYQPAVHSFSKIKRFRYTLLDVARRLLFRCKLRINISFIIDKYWQRGLTLSIYTVFNPSRILLVMFVCI